MSFISLLQEAAGAAPSASSTAGLLSTIVPFLLIIVIFYFFLIRPQNKKQKETEKMIAALKIGDTEKNGKYISSTKEKTIIVKVDDNCKIEFSRSAIAGVESEKTEKPETKKDEKEEASVEAEKK